MSITYHANFWYPRASLEVVVTKTIDDLGALGFALQEDGAPATSEEFRKSLKPWTNQSGSSLSLGPLVHLPSKAEVWFSIQDFRTNDASAIQVHVSAQEPQFRRDFSMLVHLNSGMIQFDAMLIGFYERTAAHYGHFGAGELGAWTYIKGLDHHKSATIEASKVLRDQIPLLDHVNLVPKAMYSKFLGPDDRLDRHDPRLRLAELHDEGLLIGFADCMTLGGSGASWWHFADEFNLGLDAS